MEGGRHRIGRTPELTPCDGRPVPGRPSGFAPMTLRILLSPPTALRLASRIGEVLDGHPHRLVVVPSEQPPGQEAAPTDADAEVGFLSRDVTGLSTKHRVLPATQRFYDALLDAPSLAWLHTHAAGTDRPLYARLRSRGVQVATSSGANAEVVAQTALAGMLALAREFPRLFAAQRERRWDPLIGSAPPADIGGQLAVIAGWGRIAQQLARLLKAIGLQVVIVRTRPGTDAAGHPTTTYADWHAVLARADWLVLACPLTDLTRGLVDQATLACLPARARLVNVARGEVVVEPALTEALAQGRLAGAFLDVFAQEPLPADSPLWLMPNVILTPHSAGHSAGNAGRVDAMFLDNLRRHVAGLPLANLRD